jgi:hypothetical protein
MRNPREALIDRILLLYTIAKVNEHGCMEGPFKLMKVPFRAQHAMNEERKKGFNYTYFKWDYGPLSTEIYDDRDVLVRAGYVTEVGTNGRIYLTEEGTKLLGSLRELFEENDEIVRKIDEEAKKCSNLTFGRLKELTYEIKVPYGNRAIAVKDVPRGMQVLGKVRKEEAKKVFELDDDWLDSVYGIFDRTPEDRKKLTIIKKAG